jgi:hypothetical protein
MKRIRNISAACAALKSGFITIADAYLLRSAQDS